MVIWALRCLLGRNIFRVHRLALSHPATPSGIFFLAGCRSLPRPRPWRTASSYAYQRRRHSARAFQVSQRRKGPVPRRDDSRNDRANNLLASRKVAYRSWSNDHAFFSSCIAKFSYRPCRSQLGRRGGQSRRWDDGQFRTACQICTNARTHACTHAHTHTRSLVRQGRCSCTATRPDLCKCWSGAGVGVVRVLRTGTASDGAGALDMHASGSHPGGRQAGLIRLQGGSATRRYDTTVVAGSVDNDGLACAWLGACWCR